MAKNSIRPVALSLAFFLFASAWLQACSPASVLARSHVAPGGRIAFDASFESGNATDFKETAPGTYSFRLARDTNSRDRQWFYFEVRGAAGRTLVFRLLDTDTHNVTGHWDTARPVYSRDGGANWSHIEGPTSHSDRVFTFAHSFVEQAERIAFHYPYTWSMARTRMEEWARHRDVTRTTLGLSVQGRNIDLLRVADATVPYDNAGKIGVWIVCRQHGAEATGSHTFEAFLDFLLSDAPEALALRRGAVVNAVPMANPDGVVSGNYRNNAAGINLNRVWDGSANSARSPEVLAIKNAIDSWVAAGNPYHIFFDLHSTSGGNPYFAFHAGSSLRPSRYEKPSDYHAHSRAFLALVNARAPHFHPTRGVTNSNSQRLAYHNQREQYGVLSFTFEGTYNQQNHGPDRAGPQTPERHRAVGSAMARALVEYYRMEIKEGEGADAKAKPERADSPNVPLE